MNKNNKLVIKVNYDSSNKLLTDELLNQEMIEKWNSKKIVIVLSLLFFIATGCLYYTFFKSSFPIINTPTSNSITHGQKGKDKPQITDSSEKRQEVKSEQVISEQGEADKNDKNVFDAVDEKAEDNIVTVQAIHSSLVVRSQLTNRVTNNEPADMITSPVSVNKDNIRRLYYFTELKDMSGKTIYHNWIYKGKSIFRKQFNINGNRWRVTTLKKMNNTLLGDWKVKLTDNKGHLLHEINFEVIEATRNK